MRGRSVVRLWFGNRARFGQGMSFQILELVGPIQRGSLMAATSHPAKAKPNETPSRPCLLSPHVLVDSSAFPNGIWLPSR